MLRLTGRIKQYAYQETKARNWLNTGSLHSDNWPKWDKIQQGCGHERTIIFNLRTVPESDAPEQAMKR